MWVGVFRRLLSLGCIATLSGSLLMPALARAEPSTGPARPPVEHIYANCDGHGACSGRIVSCANNRTACCCRTGSGLQICKCILNTSTHACSTTSLCPA